MMTPYETPATYTSRINTLLEITDNFKEFCDNFNLKHEDKIRNHDGCFLLKGLMYEINLTADRLKVSCDIHHDFCSLLTAHQFMRILLEKTLSFSFLCFHWTDKDHITRLIACYHFDLVRLNLARAVYGYMQTKETANLIQGCGNIYEKYKDSMDSLKLKENIKKALENLQNNQLSECDYKAVIHKSINLEMKFGDNYKHIPLLAKHIQKMVDEYDSTVFIQQLVFDQEDGFSATMAYYYNMGHFAIHASGAILGLTSNNSDDEGVLLLNPGKDYPSPNSFINLLEAAISCQYINIVSIKKLIDVISGWHGPHRTTDNP